MHGPTASSVPGARGQGSACLRSRSFADSRCSWWAQSPRPPCTTSTRLGRSDISRRGRGIGLVNSNRNMLSSRPQSHVPVTLSESSKPIREGISDGIKVVGSPATTRRVTAVSWPSFQGRHCGSYAEKKVTISGSFDFKGVDSTSIEFARRRRARRFLRQRQPVPASQYIGSKYHTGRELDGDPGAWRARPVQVGRRATQDGMAFGFHFLPGGCLLTGRAFPATATLSGVSSCGILAPAAMTLAVVAPAWTYGA